MHAWCFVFWVFCDPMCCSLHGGWSGWKAVARSLGLAPSSSRLSTPGQFQQLSFFMAAAVPTRFGHSGRQRLLATVSARDRLRAVAAIYETHPPVSRAMVRELEVAPRRRLGSSVVCSPVSLETLTVDAFVFALARQYPGAAELPRIAPHLLSQAALRASDLGLFNAVMCASLGGIGLTALHIEDKQGIQTTLNWTRAISACPNLESLELIRLTSLRDDTLQPCLELLEPTLARLSIEKCSGVTGAGLSVLAGSLVLRSLDVSGSSVTPEFLATVVPTLAELVCLDVSGTRFAFAQAAVVLPALRKLKEFFCCATKLDEGQESSLRLLGPSVTNAHFRFSEHLYDISWLRGWTQLTAIDLSLCPRIEDAMLQPLLELPALVRTAIST